MRGEDTPGGISGSLLGIFIAGVSLVLVVNGARRLLRHPKWLESSQASSPTRLVMCALIPLWPLISLLLPTLILWGSGRAVDYGTLFTYVPDIVILLLLTSLIGVITTLVRFLSIWRVR